MPTKRWVIKKVWTGKPVYYSVLKIFGYHAYVHVQSREWSKRRRKKSVYFFVSRLVLRAISYGIDFKEENWQQRCSIL